MTPLIHQANNLFNRLQDACREAPQSEKPRVWMIAQRAFRRCCRRFDAHLAARENRKPNPHWRNEDA